MNRSLCLAFAAVLSTACTAAVDGQPGTGGSPTTSGGGPNQPPLNPGAAVLQQPNGLGFVGMRRLSKDEYRRTLVQLLNVPAPAALATLPEDILTPYDNDFGSQVLSAVLIAGLSDVAREVVTAALADPATRTALVPCAPTGPGDAACLTQFVQQFGRLVLHRPLADTEVARLVQLQSFAVERNDFYAAVGLIMRALLQDAELVYRVEVGTPVSTGLVRLTPYELAARIAYTLLGAPPDAALLDAAANGHLDTSEGVRGATLRLLEDARAAERVSRLHAMWLNYENSDVPAALKASMKAESTALVTRTLFQEKKPWGDLFRSAEAFVDANLAPIYGLTPPAEPTWLTLPDPNRRGLLGQAGFLAGGAKFGDTSPVLRGLQIRARLMCQDIPPPPPTVNADQPPEGDPNDCKAARYKKHAESTCASCHALLDPIGNGLEQYGSDGKFREVENGRPDCPIEGTGTLVDLGVTFKGPAGLAEALLPTGKLERCVMKQLTQFVTGRQLEATDDPFVDALNTRFGEGSHQVPELLLSLVTSEAFRHRVTEELP
jgi:hypothetical protein